MSTLTRRQLLSLIGPAVAGRAAAAPGEEAEHHPHHGR